MGVVQDRKIAVRNLHKITEDPSKVLFIHYSESSTYDDDDYGNISPIITSIVIKSLDGQIDKQFAIHLEVDKADIPKDQIQDSYRELELRILKLYNDFVRRNLECFWIHWDMKNIHFGFEAIKHRYEKIFESLEDYCEIPNNKKKNLRTIMEGMYGDNFVSGADSLKALMLCNSDNVEDSTYLSKENESSQFENKNFTNVIRSVDLKVEFIKKATNKLINKKLIVLNKNNYAVFVDAINHPYFTLSGWIIGLIGLVLTIITML